jgi:hypothetical protein
MSAQRQTTSSAPSTKILGPRSRLHTAPPTSTFPKTLRTQPTISVFGNFSTRDSSSTSNYNSLQASLRRQFSSGLAFQVFVHLVPRARYGFGRDPDGYCQGAGLRLALTEDG